ncbi:hypothetical protein HQQ81_11520 [Microbacteriaceae bacterium VKM Ac-2854]|nr:hypothetical protein [Microbacteriaceae bacterium VKM Ac-2854]
MDPLVAPPRIRIPSAPEPARRPAFPLLAAIAPVLASGLIWALTQSPYVLAFAALGPVVAVAGYADGLRVRRRDDRRARREYTDARDRARGQIALAHDEERRAAWRAGPGAHAILAGDVPADARWRGSPANASVVLGAGVTASAVPIDGPDDDPLVSDGRRLDDAPMRVVLADGIGVHGEASLARAYLRALLIQLANELPPSAVRIALPDGAAWSWASGLPHPSTKDSPHATTPILTVADAFLDSAPAPASGALLALAPTAGELPPRCRCVVRIDGPRTASVVGRRGRGVTEQLRIELLAEQEAADFARALAEAAPALDGAGAPSRVPLRSLLAADRAPDARAGLGVVVGIGERGPVTIDLAADGPHAIVGGTTGSGKSEFLTAWVLALAARFSPADVTFLLADFKGGATFSHLAALPHCLGIITDLAPGEASRAFRSLSAELRRRERRLAEVGVKDVAAPVAHGLARLVVMVDECAFLLEQSPELHALFADVSARGRSLGVHLVLCTQRPAGVVRDAVAANCGLRVSLRVNDANDSRLVVGSDAAVRLSAGAPGRFVLGAADGPVLVQGALAEPADAERVLRPDDAGTRVHRPWLDPLPAVLPLPDHPVDALADALLGLVDRPDEQRQDPQQLGVGNLLVLGTAGSGKSGAIDALLAQRRGGIIRLDASMPEAAWDVLTAGANARNPGSLLIDDLDLLLRRYPPDHQRTVLEALATILRTAPAAGGAVVASAQRLADGLAGLQPLFGRALVLRMSSRQEHQLAGVDGPFDPSLPPGGGLWRGERIQVYRASPQTKDLRNAAAVPLAALPFGRAPIAVVASRSAATADRLRAAGALLEEVTVPESERAPTAALCGTVDQWHAARARFDRARSQGVVLFDGVTPAEVRALLGPRVVVPFCADESRMLVLRDGRIERVAHSAPGDRFRSDLTDLMLNS